jgi:intracellular sulfur oxidation DsrE/DsrF family protein
MKSLKIVPQASKSMLLPGVQTVAEGISEIVQKQGRGRGYIKVANY